MHRCVALSSLPLRYADHPSALGWGSGTGPFSAVSKPPRALWNAVRSSRACGMSSAPSFPLPCTKIEDLTTQRPLRQPPDELLRVLRHPEGSQLKGGGLLADCVGAAWSDPLVNKHAWHVLSKLRVPLSFDQNFRTARK
jgi:hypothetical protein